MLDALRDPLQWGTEHALNMHNLGSQGQLPSDEEAEEEEGGWPLDSSGQPLMVMVHDQPSWRAYTPTIKLAREASLAHIQPSQGANNGRDGKGRASRTSYRIWPIDYGDPCPSIRLSDWASSNGRRRSFWRAVPPSLQVTRAPPRRRPR